MQTPRKCFWNAPRDTSCYLTWSPPARILRNHHCAAGDLLAASVALAERHADHGQPRESRLRMPTAALYVATKGLPHCTLCAGAIQLRSRKVVAVRLAQLKGQEVQDHADLQNELLHPMGPLGQGHASPASHDVRRVALEPSGRPRRRAACRPTAHVTRPHPQNPFREKSAT